jgi:hypothetical protein
VSPEIATECALTEPSGRNLIDSVAPPYSLRELLFGAARHGSAPFIVS